MHAQAKWAFQPFKLQRQREQECLLQLAVTIRERISITQGLVRNIRGRMLHQQDMSVPEQVDWALQPFRLQRQREQECLLQLAAS